jgi:hypothetical protein
MSQNFSFGDRVVSVELRGHPVDFARFVNTVVYGDVKTILRDWIDGERETLEILDPVTQAMEIAKAQTRIQVSRYFIEMFEVFAEIGGKSDDVERDPSR